MNSRFCTISVTAVLALAALPCAAQEEFELPEFLTPEEQAERELERARKAEPVLECEPPALRGESAPGQVVKLGLSVRNAGGRLLKWSVKLSPGWLDVQPRSGELGYREKSDVSVKAHTKALAPGAHEGRIVIEAADAKGSPATVAVTLTLKAEPVKDKPAAVPDETPAKGRSEPRRGAQREPTRADGRRGRFGVRAAYHMESVGDVSKAGAGAFVGLYYRRGRFGEKRLLYELGVDAGTRDESEKYATQPFGGRLDLLFRLGGADGEKPARGYLLSGLAGFMERVEDLGTGDRYTNYAAAVDLGGGVGFLNERLDVRLSHAVFLGSDNLQGKTMLVLSYAF